MKRIFKFFKSEKPLEIFASQNAHSCVDCETKVPTYKIGRFVYHVYGTHAHSGCNIANRSNNR